MIDQNEIDELKRKFPISERSFASVIIRKLLNECELMLKQIEVFESQREDNIDW